MGIAGIIFASAIARLSTYFWYEPKLLFHEYFNSRATGYYISILKNIGLLACVFAALSYAFSGWVVTDWMTLILKVVVTAAVCSSIDYKGMALLSGWLVTLQIVLDKGNDADWFGSTWICWMTAISVVCAIMFFIFQSKNKEALIDLSVLKDRTYFFGTLVQVILMGVFLSSAALLPSMLQKLLGYTAYLSGLSMGSRGVGSFIGVALYLTLSKKLGDRRIVMIGLILLGLGSVFFGMINLQINLSTIALPNILYGSGLFMALTPLIPLSCSTTKNENMTNATGLQNLLKNIGGAIGTSVATTMVARYAQVHQNMMTNHLHETNSIFVERVGAMASTFSTMTDAATSHAMAKSQIYSQLVQQSHLWAYIDTFRWFAFATFLLIPMLVFIKKPKTKSF